MKNEEAIDVREMTRTPGWKMVEAELRQAIEAREKRLMSIEGSDPTTVGTEYIKLKAEIYGLKYALNITEASNNG